MYLFPSPAQNRQLGGDRRLDAPQLARFEPVAFACSRWPMRAMQINYGAVSVADDVHMRGAMIVKVDRGAQAIEAEHRGHRPLLAETQAVG
jgi:hypothetical protein